MRPYLTYKHNELYFEEQPLAMLVKTFNTPCYAYSKRQLLANLAEYRAALHGRKYKIFYAIKANSNLAILQTLQQAHTNFEIVSGGELHRVLAAGGTYANIIYSGVGKTHDELWLAIKNNLHCINVESHAELQQIIAIAKASNSKVNIAVRVNPNVQAGGHHYIATGTKEHKFGVKLDEAYELYKFAHLQPELHVIGIACHLGSQITTTAPLTAAIKQLLELQQQLQLHGIQLQHMNVGGGLGIDYTKPNEAPTIATWVSAINAAVTNHDLTIYLEPGRSLIGNAGILLTKVLYTKSGNPPFVIIDAAMNDLIRPALYQAQHTIVPLIEPATTATKVYNIVGPICETADFLAHNYKLPAIQAGAALAILDTGAYGFSMSSNYNSRGRAAEVLIDGTMVHLIRDRENYADLIRSEHLLG